MPRPFRSTLLVIAASMTAGLLVGPSPAYAGDTTTKLTKTELMAALTRVTTTTTAVAKAGWRAKTDSPGSLTSTSVVDPIGGLAFHQWNLGGLAGSEYNARGKGTYAYLSDSTSLAAVKVMARPSVRYAFAADKSQVLADIVKDTALATLVDVIAEQDQPGTKTVHGDGSSDLTVRTDGATITLHVATAGAVTSVKTTGNAFDMTLTYAYGRQKVTLPAAAVTVDQATLKTATAYVALAANVKTAAANGAAHTRTAAKRKTVTVASLRQIVRKDVTAVNLKICLTIVKTIDVRNGIKVYATNPWTHRTVAYTVIAAGRNVLVKTA